MAKRWGSWLGLGIKKKSQVCVVGMKLKGVHKKNEATEKEIKSTRKQNLLTSLLHEGFLFSLPATEGTCFILFSFGILDPSKQIFRVS